MWYFTLVLLFGSLKIFLSVVYWKNFNISELKPEIQRHRKDSYIEFLFLCLDIQVEKLSYFRKTKLSQDNQILRPYSR